MRPLLLLLLPTLLPGCVIKYGELPQPGVGQSSSQPVDFSDIEAELMVLRASAESSDVDQRDRIDAVLELIRLAEAGELDAAALGDYLDRVVQIEARAEADTIRTFEPPVVEEEILETPVDPPGEDTEGAAEQLEATLERAREALAREQYAAAIRSLEPIRDEGAAADLWSEAVDGFVHAERERAGELFLQARELPQGDERVAAIREVLTLLTALRDRYPENAYSDALERNIGLVERALDEAD